MDPRYVKIVLDEACEMVKELADTRMPPVSKNLPPSLQDALLAVFRGLKILHLGHALHDRKIQDKGVNLLIAGMETIDAESMVGRDIFLPYVDDKDPDIVVASAGALLQSHPELAKPRLRHVDRTCVSQASFTAMNILFFKGNGVSLGPPDPRFPKPDLPPGNEWLHDD